MHCHSYLTHCILCLIWIANDRVIQFGRELRVLLLQMWKSKSRSGCSEPHQLCQSWRGPGLSAQPVSMPCSWKHLRTSVWNPSRFGLCPSLILHCPDSGFISVLVSPTEANPAPGWTSPGPSTSAHHTIAPAHPSRSARAEITPLYQQHCCPEGLKLDARIQT